jgi:hypothetical protein
MVSSDMIPDIVDDNPKAGIIQINILKRQLSVALAPPANRGTIVMMLLDGTSIAFNWRNNYK